MAGRRSDNPLAILVMGLVAIAFFGGVITYIDQSTPVLQLRGELVRRYRQKRFVTRFVPAQLPRHPWIEVEVPPALAGSPRDLLEVGAFALRRYLRLASGTRVDACRVSVRGKPDAPAVRIPASLLPLLEQAQTSLPHLQGRLERLGLGSVGVTIEGLSRTGVHLTARGAAPTDPRARALAQDALRLLERLPYVGEATVAVRAPTGKEVTRSGGRDQWKVPPGLFQHH